MTNRSPSTRQWHPENVTQVLRKVLRIAEREFSKHPLRAWRHYRGITLAQMSALAGVSHATLSRIESGINQPSLDLAARLSRLTGINAAVFSGRRMARSQ